MSTDTRLSKPRFKAANIATLANVSKKPAAIISIDEPGAGFIFFLVNPAKRKSTSTENTRDPTIGHGAVVSEVPSITMKNAPNPNPAITASKSMSLETLLTFEGGDQETKNIETKPIRIPVNCLSDRVSPKIKPQITGNVAQATAVTGATTAIGPFAKPL